MDEQMDSDVDEAEHESDSASLRGLMKPSPEEDEEQRDFKLDLSQESEGESNLMDTSEQLMNLDASRNSRQQSYLRDEDLPVRP